MKPTKIPGYKFAGIHCGIKEKSTKKDLAVICSQCPGTTIAGVFTNNKVKAAPVIWCQKQIKGGQGQLVVINSGIANAATGPQGFKDTQKMARKAAAIFGVSLKKTLVCSTGKIGEKLPLTKIQKGLVRLKEKTSSKNLKDCARAIMTTDAYPKTAFHKGKMGTRPFHIAVIAKGAGMISPDMATMLCFVVTDLNIKATTLQSLLKEAVDETLNCLNVDGDTSTNDTILMMANGMAENKSFSKGSMPYKKIKTALISLLDDTCLQIAADGEGASRCFKVFVRGAKDKKDANLVSKAISKSLLVKTAVFGGDPNWGRILAAAGYSGAKIKEEKTTIQIGPHTVFTKGLPQKKNEKKAALYMKKNKVLDLTVCLGVGLSGSRAYGCDLGYGYVRLNAEYRT